MNSMGLAYRFHKVRRGVVRYGLAQTALGLRRLFHYRLHEPLEGMIRTACDDLAIHFQYPRQFMPTLALFGELVEPEYWLVRRLITSASVVVDVGGGIGTYALTAACRGAAAVHVFEPTGEGCAAIRRNLRANALDSRVVVNQLALSDVCGTLTMARRESLFVGRVGGGRGPTESVATVTLDEYCARRGIERIDILKVDVEGHEPQVLAGARELLSRGACDVMILEVDPGRAALYRTLAARGYRAYYYDDERHALLSVEPLTERRLQDLKPRGFHSNVVLIRDGRYPEIDRIAPRFQSQR